MNVHVVFSYLMALFAGSLGAIHMPLNGALGMRIKSTPITVMVLFGIAFFLSSVIVLFSGEREAFKALKTVPLWYFLPGVISLIVVSSNTYLIPRLGAIQVFVVVIFAQLTGRMLISHFGLFDTPTSPISPSKLVGGAMLLIGALLVVKD